MTFIKVGTQRIPCKLNASQLHNRVCALLTGLPVVFSKNNNCLLDSFFFQAGIRKAEKKNFQSALINSYQNLQLDRVKRIWCLSPMRAAKVQASLRIRAVSPEPSLLAHTSSESRGTLRQRARSMAPLNGWACAVEICHDGMLEDTNSLDGAQLNLGVIL